MTLTEIKTMLEGIMPDKVVYYAWPENEAPALPFICYHEVGTNNFGADDAVYLEVRDVDIELYAKQRDLTSETLIETALNNEHIYWNRSVDYLQSEKCYMTTYSIEV